MIRVGRFLICSALLAAGVAGAEPPGELRYSRSPDTVVVEFRETLSELRSYGPGPTVRIHGDGRVEVDRPVYMKRAGAWTRQLAPAELDALVARLADRGVLEFDVTTADARQPGATLPAETSDASVVELILRVERQPAGGPLALAAPIETRVAVRGLADAARARPEDLGLADLAEACAELRGMIDATDQMVQP